MGTNPRQIVAMPQHGDAGSFSNVFTRVRARPQEKGFFFAAPIVRSPTHPMPVCEGNAAASLSQSCPGMRLPSRSPQRSSQRRSAFWRAAIRSALVHQAGSRNRLRGTLQPLTSCRDSRLRWSWQR